MAHKYEHISTGAGYKVRNSGVESTVIAQSGKKFALVAGTTQPTAVGQMTYVSGVGYRFQDASGIFTVPRTGGGGGGGTLDSAYENGPNVQIDAGATTWTDTNSGSLNGFELVKSGAGSGNLLDLSLDAAATGAALAIDANLGIAAEAIFIDNGGTARTGSDILVTADGSGNHSVLDVNDTGTGDTKVVDVVTSGTGATTGLYYKGSYNGAPAGYGVNIVLDDGDATDTIPILITAGTGTRNNALFQIVNTGTGSGALIDLSMDGNATGDGITIDLNNAVDSKAIYIDGGNGARTDDIIEVKHDGTGNTDVFSIVATNTGSGAIFDIDMDGDGSDAGVFNVDMNAAVGAEFLYLDSGAGVRTANLLHIIYEGSGSVDCFAIVANDTSSGHIFDIDMTGIHTGNVFDIDLDAAVDAYGIYFDGGADTRTVPAIYLKHDGDGNVGFIGTDVTNTGSGHVIEITYGNAINTGDAIHIDFFGAAASTGNGLYIDTGSNIAGNAISILTAGARTSPVIFINGVGTDGGTDDHIIDINQSGQLDSNILDITYSSAASTGNAIDLNMGTNIAGSAIDINATGARTGALVNIASNATDTGVDDHTIFITQTGQQDSNMIQLTYGTAASTGDAVSIIMDTNLAGSALVITRTGVVVDDTIKIDSDQTGATHQFDINLTGAASGNCFDLTYSSGANTGNAIDLNMGSNVAGMAISVGSAATGTSGEGSCLDIVHTGNLGAGADVVRITSTGNNSATSNLLSVEQSSGTGTAGTFTGYFSATGTNVEGLKVDDGVTFLDEGFQVEAVSRTANATPGSGTSTVADGERHITVTSSSANNVIVLPTPTPGYEVYLYVGSNGYELRTSAPASVAINGGTGASAESAIVATTLTKCICTSATTWVCQDIDSVGDVTATEVAS